MQQAYGVADGPHPLYGILLGEAVHFERSVSRLPEVLSVHTMAGNDDFLVHVAVQDIEHLHAFLLDRFTNRREILSFRTMIIYRHLTNQVLDPLPPAEITRSAPPAPPARTPPRPRRRR